MSFCVCACVRSRMRVPDSLCDVFKRVFVRLRVSWHECVCFGMHVRLSVYVGTFVCMSTSFPPLRNTLM